ncbi:MAG TPA: UDP-N-acetylmuramoyl-L-alanyl-D-glutamate--2,6-diaminopimelate ligase [Deltaproteobacteria bacterium]|nr:UDP-N-acetylmuramoyl-L-alanyl-D-glutamate--2,6-diaminopimelate ligase [Deltaproteobacteria bacterium]HPJ92798.1 UDP-N-acetylmuramoyl-L-alanyl-D-glutamate--2,6-diaminopimelate ligase [Deltaproteobacteria bacterium]HPR50317.1 UDP-N-acetylmuramoyl-L-alanyl-D-glutamate--2,6-diaminopimelate ligase [Deltaproteobacteria bacterium]
MKVSELAAIIPGAQISGPEKDITSLKMNSSDIQTGDAFIALKGSITDGHKYIPDAIKSGAGIIICNHEGCDADPGATFMRVPDTKSALRTILPVLYPHAADVCLIGITGTNGKTTTTYLIESVLKDAGMNPGVLGTINMRYADVTVASSITTPGPIELFERLETMSSAGVDTCIMEVSSHALHQDRLAGIRFDYGIFTNLSQDHLDYHRDMETYFLAKKMLFDDYLEGVAIVNIDDPYGQLLAKELKDPVTYGHDPLAMIRTTSIEHTSSGLRLDLATPDGPVSLSSFLLGDINAYNIMASVALCRAMGIDMQSVISGIGSLKCVPGRMERVDNPCSLKVLVDYAHTPAALETALASAKKLTNGRLIAVFGCGGDRDQAKRPIMGRIASELADMVIVTSDNPRTEDPQAIINDIFSGISKSTHIMMEPDRAAAIRLAVSSMEKDDCLIIAGKGHEDYQIIGKVKKPFDDKLHVLKSIEEIYH